MDSISTVLLSKARVPKITVPPRLPDGATLELLITILESKRTLDLFQTLYPEGWLSPERKFWYAETSFGRFKMSIRGGGFWTEDSLHSQDPIPGSSPLILWMVRYYPESLDAEFRVRKGAGASFRRAYAELKTWVEGTIEPAPSVLIDPTHSGPLRSSEEYHDLKWVVFETLRTNHKQTYRGRAKPLLKLVWTAFPEAKEIWEFGSWYRFGDLLDTWEGDSATEDFFSIRSRAHRGGGRIFTLKIEP